MHALSIAWEIVKQGASLACAIYYVYFIVTTVRAMKKIEAAQKLIFLEQEKLSFRQGLIYGTLTKTEQPKALFDPVDVDEDDPDEDSAVVKFKQWMEAYYPPLKK